MRKTIKQRMKAIGYDVTQSGGGCEWYSKEVCEGLIYFTITDMDGIHIPVRLDQKIIMCVHDADSESVLYNGNMTLRGILEGEENANTHSV